jgi:hypothetical protein
MSKFSPINFPYGDCLIKSNVDQRDYPTSATFASTKVCLNNNVNLVPSLYKDPTLQTIAKQNSTTANNMDKYFLNQVTDEYPRGYSTSYFTEANPDLQSERPPEVNKNSYIELASESLHVYPDLVMSVFFSDSNIQHLRNIVVSKVKEITGQSGVAGTPEGVTIQTPNMDDFFNYMLNVYNNYKIYNGSICFINSIQNIKEKELVKTEITKLNSNILQDYVSKMVSQINMYIYYYKDASQLPEQLSLPEYNSMKGSKTLEYNVGFKSGNSLGISSYSQVSNIP